MEIQFDSERVRRNTPSTKLYAPQRDAEESTAGFTAGASRRVTQQTDFLETARQQTHPGQKMNTASRVAILGCAFLLAGMVLFILTGYERITRAYSDINTLNSQIETAQLHINELDVAIECAVTIQDAQNAAKRYGMQYPEQSQYVKSGSDIPLTAPTSPDTPDDGE